MRTFLLSYALFPIYLNNSLITVLILCREEKDVSNDMA